MSKSSYNIFEKTDGFKSSNESLNRFFDQCTYEVILNRTCSLKWRLNVWERGAEYIYIFIYKRHLWYFTINTTIYNIVGFLVKREAVAHLCARADGMASGNRDSVIPKSLTDKFTTKNSAGFRDDLLR